MTDQPTADAIGRQRVIPILRIFDRAIAREFYCDVVGFTWEWEHQFGSAFPCYAQVQREGCVLHLSEHHGDGTPGTAVMVVVDDIEACLAQVRNSGTRMARPEIEEADWGRTMPILDPFGNRLIFWQR